MITFERLDLDHLPIKSPNLGGEWNVFQTQEWLTFIADIHHAEPVIIEISSSGQLQGYFTGLIINKFGIKILGSPFRGWVTYFMGFILSKNAEKHEILKCFPHYVFDELDCIYMEIIDPNLSEADWCGLGYTAEDLYYYGVDLSKAEEELLAGMDSSGRNCIRKSIKSGVVIEEAYDDTFAVDYYKQYEEVLTRHSLTPAYSLEVVQKLIDYIYPTGNLLLLRARDSEGSCIATAIFISLNETAIFWGAASCRQYQSLRPNEPLAWYGMKKMKERGAQIMHFGGKCANYKEKLGATHQPLFRIMKTKYQILSSFLSPMVTPKNEKYRNWMLRHSNI